MFYMYKLQVLPLLVERNLGGHSGKEFCQVLGELAHLKSVVFSYVGYWSDFSSGKSSVVTHVLNRSDLHKPAEPLLSSTKYVNNGLKNDPANTNIPICISLSGTSGICSL